MTDASRALDVVATAAFFLVDAISVFLLGFGFAVVRSLAPESAHQVERGVESRGSIGEALGQFGVDLGPARRWFREYRRHLMRRPYGEYMPYGIDYGGVRDQAAFDE